MSDTTHDLKTWPAFFAALVTGSKTFEVRKNDRGFRVGDTLRLREWEPSTETYSGREETRTVSYILSAPDWGVREGFVVLALSRLPEARPTPGSEDERTVFMVPKDVPLIGGFKEGFRNRTGDGRDDDAAAVDVAAGDQVDATK